MKFPNIPVAILVLLGKGRAKYYLTGNGYPFNYDGNRFSYHENVSLEECENLCNNQSGCTTILWDHIDNWCDLENVNANVFSLVQPNGGFHTYSKAENL